MMPNRSGKAHFVHFPSSLTVFLTDFADQAVILPTCIAMVACVAIMGWQRGAAALLGFTALTLACILALKLAFGACGEIAAQTDIHSPSGHAAAAAVTAGGLAVLLWARHPKRFFIAVACAAAAAIAIGATRVVLNDHTVADVAAGSPFGVIGAALIARFAGRPTSRFNGGLALIVALLIMIAFNGTHLRAETLIRHAARSLECPGLTI